MKIKAELLLKYLKNNKLSKMQLASGMGIKISELEILIDGQAVDEPVARKFIYYFGYERAQELIDWEAMGVENPL